MPRATSLTCYYHGQGVPQDYVTSAAWLRRAADQGDPRTQFNLGIMYAAGQGVPQDYVQAHKWLNLTASGEKTPEKATENRNIVAAKMTPAQIAEAQKLAREWKPKPER